MAWTEDSPTKGKVRGAYRDHEGKIRRRTFSRKRDAMLWALNM